MAAALSDIVCCPRCHARLETRENKIVCTDAECLYASEGFDSAGGQPVLIDFERSIFNRPGPGDPMLSVLRRDDMGRSLHSRVLDIFEGSNQTAVDNSQAVLRALKSLSQEPKLLIIGGGGLGAGVETFLQDLSVQVVGTDVYASTNTHLVTDAHHLPFGDGVFDGVWITAVLEHVIEPQVVVDEIWRVLKSGGLVYAETPFMQQVHEGAWDFTRFTANDIDGCSAASSRSTPASTGARARDMRWLGRFATSCRHLLATGSRSCPHCRFSYYGISMALPARAAELMQPRDFTFGAENPDAR